MSGRNRNRRGLVFLAYLGVVLCTTTTAHAHSVNKQFGDFYGGMLHPLTALEHLLPILGLSDKTTFLCARGEHYFTALFCIFFMSAPGGVWIAGAPST